MCLWLQGCVCALLADIMCRLVIALSPQPPAVGRSQSLMAFSPAPTPSAARHVLAVATAAILVHLLPHAPMECTQ